MKTIKVVLIYVFSVFSCFAFGQDAVKRDTISQNSEKVFTIVEEMPQFPGGDEGLKKYLMKEVDYPKEAKKKGITGKVFVTFVVTNTGKVTDVRILRGAGNGFDEEVLRVIKAMPDWTPGKQDGKPVNVQFTLPVNFTL